MRIIYGHEFYAGLSARKLYSQIYPRRRHFMTIPWARIYRAFSPKDFGSYYNLRIVQKRCSLILLSNYIYLRAEGPA